MGEYALYLGKEKVKIGTCEDMYYLRHDHINKVVAISGNIDPHKTVGLRFRLPFSDEDYIEPVGNYKVFNRMEPLGGFPADDLTDNPGIIQFHHESGLLINVPCYHGAKLPTMDGVRTFWNGKASWFIGLSAIKNVQRDVLRPVITCRYCRQSWLCDWDDVLDYVTDETLKARLQEYNH